MADLPNKINRCKPALQAAEYYINKYIISTTYTSIHEQDRLLVQRNPLISIAQIVEKIASNVTR